MNLLVTVLSPSAVIAVVSRKVSKTLILSTTSAGRSPKELKPATKTKPMANHGTKTGVRAPLRLALRLERPRGVPSVAGAGVRSGLEGAQSIAVGARRVRTEDGAHDCGEGLSVGRRV